MPPRVRGQPLTLLVRGALFACRCFEPYTSNIYVRRTLAGEFVCVSRHLLKDLIDLGLWTPQLKDAIIAANGSVQQIPSIPAHIKALYRTVWEISQKVIIDMAADRGAYIDQSQSLNIHMTNANAAKLTSMHFHAWKKGLKTGMYYLRTKAATDAIKFTLDPALQQQVGTQAQAGRGVSGGQAAAVGGGAVVHAQMPALLESAMPPTFAAVSRAASPGRTAELARLEEMTPEERRLVKERQEDEIQCSLSSKECVMCGS